jgi:complex iron-sulfur molybdoenzyme family reductase subunit alpha
MVMDSEQPGRVTMYHGWEKYLGFQEGGWQSLTYIKIKPTQLVGKYGHVVFRPNYWGPTGNNRDVKVDVERVGPAEWASVPDHLLRPPKQRGGRVI